LNLDDYGPKLLRQHIKETVREIEREDSVLIFGISLQEKPYIDENELVCWRFDHAQGREDMPKFCRRYRLWKPGSRGLGVLKNPNKSNNLLLAFVP
jgi:hypothetical protein